MESSPALPLLHHVLLLLFAVTTASSAAQNRQQMENILDTLVGAGDFGNWASILSSGDRSILPVTATLFIPSDSDYDVVSSGSHLSPFLLFPYHIVPNRLSFSDLRNYPINSRIPTLLPGFSLLITNNSKYNFTIDGVSITNPDLYQNAALSAHGVAAPFDYTVFGNFEFKGVYGNSTTVNAAAPQPEIRRRMKPKGRPSTGSSVAPASGSTSSLAVMICEFSWILTMVGMLGLGFT